MNPLTALRATLAKVIYLENQYRIIITITLYEHE
jgi:hypothetical protein